MHMLIKINCTDLFIASKIVGKKHYLLLNIKKRFKSQ